MYTPLNLKFRPPQEKYATTLMSKTGENLRDLPQLLTTDFALKITNYVVTTDGGLAKRKGLEKLFEVASTSPITMLEKFTDDIYIYGYGTTVSAYTLSTGVSTVIKNNFGAGDFSGARYGEYFFVANGTGGIYRIDGALTITLISGSPLAKVLKAIGPRLYAGNLSTDSTAVAYSDIDTGANPPFTNWTVGTLATDPGLVSYRNAGPVNSIELLGNNIIVFGVNGKWAFNTTTFDSNGTTRKVDNLIMNRADFGGASGALTTPKGLFYVNKGGLWQLVSVGQPNIPFSDQEGLVSVLLGTTYFDNINLDNCDITYDVKINTIFITCAKDSDVNNFVLCYNTENKAFFELKGWNINRFMNDNQNIYGGSSNGTKVWSCFKGFSDDGLDIYTEYYQELNAGSLQSRKMLYGGYVQGYLSPSSVIKMRFDIYDVTGKLITDKLSYDWTTESAVGSGAGYGQISWGTGAIGGDQDFAGTIENFNGFRNYIRNFQRIRVHFTSQDKLPHIINWASIDTRQKIDIRRRKLTLS